MNLRSQLEMPMNGIYVRISIDDDAFWRLPPTGITLRYSFARIPLGSLRRSHQQSRRVVSSARAALPTKAPAIEPARIAPAKPIRGLMITVSSQPKLASIAAQSNAQCAFRIGCFQRPEIVSLLRNLRILHEAPTVHRFPNCRQPGSVHAFWPARLSSFKLKGI